MGAVLKINGVNIAIRLQTSMEFASCDQNVSLQLYLGLKGSPLEIFQIVMSCVGCREERENICNTASLDAFCSTRYADTKSP